MDRDGTIDTEDRDRQTNYRDAQADRTDMDRQRADMDNQKGTMDTHKPSSWQTSIQTMQTLNENISVASVYCHFPHAECSSVIPNKAYLPSPPPEAEEPHCQCPSPCLIFNFQLDLDSAFDLT